MKKSIIKTMALLLLSGALLTNCKKAETGPKGDTGATGAMGATGAAGQNGANGTNGINGNANVITTNTVQLNSWAGSSTGYSTTITSPALTQSVFDNGVVMVFLQEDGWLPLPFTGLVNPSDLLTYEILPNSLGIYYINNNGTTSNPSAFGLVVKLVIIPHAMIKPNVNYKNYNDFVKAYGLAD